MSTRTGLHLEVRGAVQGVGFRPFVYRLARELGLRGSVSNSVQGVVIDLEGDAGARDEFVARMQSEAPVCATIRRVERTDVPARGAGEFEIVASGEGDISRPGEVLPDLATCDDCLAEVRDPANRRYQYPFTNCTHCGPRYSIVHALPYDRKHTTMSGFTMCVACQAEYDDPCDRRFHAQPNACPVCGPKVAFGEFDGPEAMEAAAVAIRDGLIVAVKGIGGFHLVVDATNPEAIGRLRARKHRPDKPLAVMFPDLASVETECETEPLESSLLRSPAAPIVLLRRRAGSRLPDELAPGNPWLGVFLPYSPLHHILLDLLGGPVVMTSGNLSDEPICIENDEALARLGGVADCFLTHDRPIERAVDDSLIRIVAGRELMLRRSRGYAPAPVEMDVDLTPVIALGGDMKNTICVASGDRAFLSQHHGDLATAASHEAFLKHLGDLPGLCRVGPLVVACDLHPGYHSSRAADGRGLPVVQVQHHHAHIAACLAENGVHEEVLGVSWDGTGFGPDETIWGGEFLRATQTDYERIAHLRTFLLPGGEKAVREPRFVALGMLHELEIPVRDTPLASAFEEQELRIAATMMEKGINSPRTSSAGRLFDGVAALLGIRRRNAFEGQAAMELEFAIEGDGQAYAVWEQAGDWEPIVRGILEDLGKGVPAGMIAGRFHSSMVELIMVAARGAGLRKVALSGGCFQNRSLTEIAISRLEEEGFEPLWHRFVPPNDGGLAIGQAVIAGSR
jgi:hydrogenase maturation protein HypF